MEQRKERNYLPVVVAEPTAGKIATEPLIDEDNDIEKNNFSRFYYDGKLEYKKPKHQPLYMKFNTYGYKKRQKQVIKQRGQKEAQILRKAGLV